MNCKSCNGNDIRLKINFGEQPPSNRYQTKKDVEKDTHPLNIGVCNSCGLLQLINPMPVDMVRSRYSWVKYNEPEFHLDDLVEELIKLPGIYNNSKIVGLTYKDESTIGRLERKGFQNLHNTKMPEINHSAGLYDGLETIQKIVTEGNDFGLDTEIDILLVRHVLEHAHDLNTFLKNIAPNVKKGGYLVFEIPDSKKFLQNKNYCFIWEEHIVYFTDTTFRSFFEKNGFEVVEIFRYEAALEDSLVAIIRNTNVKQETSHAAIQAEINSIDLFADSFPKTKDIHRQFLEEANAAGKKVAIFGAGHLAAKYINLFELKNFISCVIDDSRDKENLFMPGSSVQIMNSAVLPEIDICLLALSPESQKKVLDLKRGLIKPGGKFYSIFDNQLTSI